MNSKTFCVIVDAFKLSETSETFRVVELRLPKLLGCSVSCLFGFVELQEFGVLISTVLFGRA